jgi:hypothetical protein
MTADQIPAKPICQQQRITELPPIDWLGKKYRYDPESGIIYGRYNRPINGKISGYIAVCLSYRGVKITIKGHRLAFALKTGRWPHLIRHKDDNKLNNKWANIEEGTSSQNNLDRFKNHNYRITEIRQSKRKQKRWSVHSGTKRQHYSTFCETWKQLQLVEEWREAGRQGPAPAKKAKPTGRPRKTEKANNKPTPPKRSRTATGDSAAGQGEA